MSSAAPVASAAATRRSLAPDLARGFMLLLIGLAYGSLYLDHSVTFLAPAATSAVDRVVNFLRTVLVHERSYTMFTALFGYGMVMVTAKLVRLGYDQDAVKKLIRRRGLLLLLFGFVHGALIFSGEILGTYGLASLLLAGVVLRDDRRLKRATIIFLSVQGVFLAWLWTGAYATGAVDGMMDAAAAAGPTSYVESVIIRALEYPVTPVFVLLMYPVIPVLLIGVWAGRRRLLEDATAHRALLTRGALIGTAVSITGAVPLGLINGGWLTAEPLSTGAWVALHNLTGIVGGLGYLAIFGLLGDRLQAAGGWITSALSATGQRSMTAYLTMSALIAISLAPWGLGIGPQLSVAGAAAASFGCWAVAVAFCVVLARLGRPGPADALLRRLLYRSPSA